MLVETPGRENDAVLAGRRMETEYLSGVVRRRRTGQGAVLEITGDPGIGKTSLLGLLARRAAAGGGARVMRAQGSQGAEPGQVVREVLDALEVPRSRVANAGVHTGSRSSLLNNQMAAKVCRGTPALCSSTGSPRTGQTGAVRL
ncbi:AAA family ATPase [Streptomyces sp. NRRL S-646]|uniref:AAA family ATPase n=1 Tax=Streptomyces sp. NRRL S-646 TaxID=1463917 RepID=UPI0004CC358E|nr:AAA family ATPase [Streptomyces sp. NRRL S-646]